MKSLRCAGGCEGRAERLGAGASSGEGLGVSSGRAPLGGGAAGTCN